MSEADQNQSTEPGVIPRWRVQQALREYADMMDSGEVPVRTGPEALREAARVMEHVG